MKSPGREPPFLRAIDQRAFETYQWKGRGAVALVTNELGEFLLNLRDDKPEIPHPNLWSLLGGGCEDDEDPLQTVLREVYEEAELTAEKADPLCRVVDIEGSQGLITVFRIATTARLTDLQLHEGQELRFFSLRQTYEIPVVLLVRDILNQFSKPI
ncbi:MAG: NUDIX domain-containing protein [Actinomycetota bacterium]